MYKEKRERKKLKYPTRIETIMIQVLFHRLKNIYIHLEKKVAPCFEKFPNVIGKSRRRRRRRRRKKAIRELRERDGGP